jgi:transposase
MERKVKYSYTFKLGCVELVTKKHYTYGYVSQQKGLEQSIVRKWVGVYKSKGKIGLHPRKNSNYSISFKLKVLKTLEQDCLSLSETRLKFDISSDSIIIKWKRDYAKFGIEGLHPKPRGRPNSMSKNKRKKRISDKPLTREEELLKENERLRCENDLLKKLHALAQAKKNQKPL